MSWDQAVAVKKLYGSLTNEQRTRLADLRSHYGPSQGFTGTELYQQCLACHQNENVAPDLKSIVNRKVASTAFRYSPAMLQFSKDNPVWTDELLFEYLRSPQKTIPGTTMSFRGLDDTQSARTLVQFLIELH